MADPTRRHQAVHDEAPSTWPFDVSHEPTLKIGEVRELLSAEFPMLAVSKIRHYESLDLISPRRTPSNQRVFSQADVERLRFILVEQRDRYLPLSQIKELLRQLDSGQAGAEHPGRMRAVDTGEMARPKPGTRLTKTEVADLTGASIEQIEDFASAGILAIDPRGRLTSQSVDIVRYGMMAIELGLDVRKVRSMKNSAHAHASLISAALAPQLAKQSTLERERAYAQSTELAAVLVGLYQALLVENVEVELS